MIAPLLFLATSVGSPGQPPQAVDAEYAIGEFAHSLSDAIPKRDGQNVLFSPYSVASCLALLLPGVGNADRAKLISALHLPTASTSELDGAFQQLAANLDNAESPQMVVANSVWTGPGIRLKSGYANEISRAFNAQATPLTFTGSAGARQINNWVSQATKKRIPRLFDSIPSDVRAVLVNAIAFDGVWQQPFNANRTAEKPFHAATGDVPARTMIDQRRLGYAKTQGYEAVQIAYTGGRYRMIVMLPTPGTDPMHTLRTLDTNQLPAFMTMLVDLQLPKFKFSTRYDLTGALGKLGLGSFAHAFDASPMLSDPRKMELSQLLHAGYIEVDEHGTKAAASTGATVRPTAILAPPRRVVFHVDRPFAFVILDGALPVFEGAVYDPNAD